MNLSHMSDSIYRNLTIKELDPIFKANKRCREDSRPNKINLVIGVFVDKGVPPKLSACHKAEQRILAREEKPSRPDDGQGYLPGEGLQRFNDLTRTILLDPESFLAGKPSAPQKNAVSIQSVGGTNAVYVGGALLKHILPDSIVAISDPTWGVHFQIFRDKLKFKTVKYEYLDPKTRAFRFDLMLKALSALPPKSIVLLQEVHNPTGLGPTKEQWDQIGVLCIKNQLVPFFDSAYQGFGNGIVEDVYAVRKFVALGLQCIVAHSFSKSFSAYNKRVGVAHFLGLNEESERQAVLTTALNEEVRPTTSNPPKFGAMVVAEVLEDPALFKEWQSELESWRRRIVEMRAKLVDALEARGVKRLLSPLREGRGMFALLPLSADEVEKIVAEDGLHLLSTGRINIAGIDSQNFERVVEILAKHMA